VSDTPRTDAAYFKPDATMYDLAGEMKLIERELNTARKRIKRLEEAGDLMVQHFYTDEPRSEMWEKAKEAKP